MKNRFTKKSFYFHRKKDSKSLTWTPGAHLQTTDAFYNRTFSNECKNFQMLNIIVLVSMHENLEFFAYFRYVNFFAIARSQT